MEECVAWFFCHELAHLSHPCTSHTFKIAADGSFVNTILDGKLFYGLLPVYIIGDYLWFIPTMATEELPSAILTFIQLFAASESIPDHIFRPTEKAFFKHINDNLYRDKKINRLQRFHPTKCPPRQNSHSSCFSVVRTFGAQWTFLSLWSLPHITDQ